MTPSLPSETLTPRVNAVVLNWCDEVLTAACLESLLESEYPELSILLVDNASPDGSGEALRDRFPKVDCLQTGANLGYSGGNNRGIERALASGADFVLVLNNDTRVMPGLVRSLADALTAAPDAGAASPTILRMDDPATVWYAGGYFDPKRGLGVHWNGKGNRAQDVAPRPVSFFTGCAVLFSRRALEEVGNFSEDFFMYVEDAELSVRLRRGGWTILHDPGSSVLHRLPPEGSDPTPSQIRLRDRNRRRLVRRHLGPVARLRFAAWFLPTRIAHLARYTAQGEFERAGAVLRGMTER